LKFHDLESPIIIGKKDRRALMIDALIILLALISISPKAWAQSCVGNPAAVQILGSGGPRTNGVRASSSYLLWVGSQARVLVDMGGGGFLRFGQSQAKLSDLMLTLLQREKLLGRIISLYSIRFVSQPRRRDHPLSVQIVRVGIANR
jgi:hypothetical protein